MIENPQEAQQASSGAPGQPIPVHPGKIIAVHVAYESRAAQRGRKPAVPSYFLKPASSLGGSGAAVERPAGTELLAYEGEIARAGSWRDLRSASAPVVMP